MDKQKYFNLIEKSTKGECSVREKELLENYLESFQNNNGKGSILKSKKKDQGGYYEKDIFTFCSNCSSDSI